MEGVRLKKSEHLARDNGIVLAEDDENPRKQSWGDRSRCQTIQKTEGMGLADWFVISRITLA